MAIEKVLVTVKTYPCLSKKYDELVCTAGLREDGTWIRIFPVPFRKLKPYSQYRKYDWVEVDVVKNQSDFRPESYRPVNLDAAFKVVGHIDTKNNWEARKEFVLRNVYTDMGKLLEDCKKTQMSLAVLKANITDLVIDEVEREWDPKKLEAVKANQNQLDLFEKKEVFEVVRKLPYEFSYKFTTDDGKPHKLMIEDWELGALYWKCLEDNGFDEGVACEKVKQMYYDKMVGNCDLYLFLGTTKEYQQRKMPNPFVVIGTFYPPKTPKRDAEQLMLF